MSSKRFSNKLLLVFFGVLVLIFVITNYFKEKSVSRNALPNQLFEVSTDAITSINIFQYNSNQGEEIRLTNNPNEGWRVYDPSENITSQASQKAINQVIDQLFEMKPQKLLTRSQEQWVNYGLTDSLAVKLIVEQKNKKNTIVYVGKLDNATPNQREGGGITYVRLGGQRSVYAVNGFLSMSVRRGFNAWRNAVVSKLDPSKVTSIKFRYKKGGNFQLIKKDTLWSIEDKEVRKKTVESYLKAIKDRKERNFLDSFTPSLEMDYEVVISGDSMEDLRVKCWIDSSGDYVLESSLNMNSYFKISSDKGVFKDLFFQKEDFL